MSDRYDVVVIGSGFGGSVSALRLSEKGYDVAVIEKGRRFAAEDFPKTNWELKRWLWLPLMNLRGIFKMTFFRHVTVLSGVGVGGGSLVYANTLPKPTDEFFRAASWGHLADWKAELEPHYETARKMLGAVTNPIRTPADEVLGHVAKELGREEHHRPNEVAVYFGEPGKTVPDPFFDGRGPERTGCKLCGACMTGCRHGAKNTLDKNYLYLAERLGAEVIERTEVCAVRPDGEGGYIIEAVEWTGWIGRRRRRYAARQVVFAGGVLGTMDLLLRMKRDSRGLPNLSPRLGDAVRTNSESLIAAISSDEEADYSTGIAITSIVHTDAHSHVEPVRYGAGSTFFRLLALPHAPGRSLLQRLATTLRTIRDKPKVWLNAMAKWDYSKQTIILLYMRTLEGTLSLKRLPRPWALFRRRLTTTVTDGDPPAAFIPEATDIADRVAKKLDGVTMGLATETLAGTPSTAHILGGCCMGASADDGVIDVDHKVFGYDGLYVIDGSAVSANPGVNPSLTITALAERAMARFPAKLAQ